MSSSKAERAPLLPPNPSSSSASRGAGPTPLFLLPLPISVPPPSFEAADRRARERVISAWVCGLGIWLILGGAVGGAWGDNWGAGAVHHRRGARVDLEVVVESRGQVVRPPPLPFLVRYSLQR